MTVKVVMYTTAVCPYCMRAKQLLNARGVAQIDEMRVDLDPELRDAMMEKTQRRTVPQIFIGDTHVGGCDDLYALDAAGALPRGAATAGRLLATPRRGPSALRRSTTAAEP